MDDQELNLRAGLAAYYFADRVVPISIERFDPLGSHDDLVRLLLHTGIYFSRPSNVTVAAEDGENIIEVIIEEGNVLAAAARAACSLAASWVSDNDVTAWRIATGRLSR